MKNAQPRVLVAAGANLPVDDTPPAATLRVAFQCLADMGFSALAVSRLYRTPCFPAGAGPDYVNAALSALPPPGAEADEVLDLLHRTEARFGRTRETRWGMRTLDLDLLAYGDRVFPDAVTQDQWRALPPEEQVRIAPDRLILPHPRLQDRAFVLVPLADVAPDWVHPRLGLTVRQMLDRLPARDRDEVVPLSV